MKFVVDKILNFQNHFKSSEKTSCLLGKESTFEGIIKLNGNARIDGQFKGELLGGETLFIGKDAIIESKIHASSVISYGEIHGNIYAKKEIELHVPGKVYGNIEAPSVEIEKGVVFEGTSWQRKPKLIDDEKLELKKSLEELKDV